MPSTAGFSSVLSLTTGAMLEIFALCAIGVVLAKWRVIDSENVDFLTRLIIDLLLPLMIFTKLIEDFRPGTPDYAGWAWMPLVAIVGMGSFLLLSTIPARLLCPPEKRAPFVTMLGFQNAGFIPIVLVEGVWRAPELAAAHDRMLVLLFLFILGQSPLMWVTAPAIMRRTLSKERQAALLDAPGWRRWRGILSGPFVANIAGIVLCMAHIPEKIPAHWLEAGLGPLKELGDCTVPLIMVTLGAMLGLLSSANRPAKREVGTLVALRLLIMPILGLAILIPLVRAGLPHVWATALFLQTLTPTATNIAVIARRYGSAEASEFVNHSMLIIYLFSILSVPVWMTIWALKMGLGG
ncbi:MAG: AEC family transporter [Candidatus Sumerlaeota bacterium]|nr:AEC family transporter [Candidatus Sumerlaeota bacterium]